MPFKKKLTAILLLLSVLLLNQCKKTAPDPDADLQNLARATTGMSYYKNDSTILKSSSASAHKPYFRMKYNATAFTAMTDNGKLPVGSFFPSGSVVVKELFDSPTSVVGAYAIMKKVPGNPSADGGWLWGEYYADGRTVHTVAQKGDGCIGCHSTNNRDYNRVFDLFQ